MLSLEKWGESQNKRILAVSADKGWADFSQDSEWIDVEPDLVKALQTLQKQRAEKERDLRVEAGLAAMLRNLNRGDLPDLWEGVRDGIAHAVHRIEAYGDATSSPYFLKNEWVTLSLSDFRFSGGDAETNLSIVQIVDDTVVARDCRCPYMRATRATFALRLPFAPREIEFNRQFEDSLSGVVARKSAIACVAR